MITAVSIDDHRRTCRIRNFIPESPDAIEKFTLRQAFGSPVVGPDKQCGMHRQQSVVSKFTWQQALMFFVALDDSGSHAWFKPFKSFKQFKP
jgi:hypothetical protein